MEKWYRKEDYPLENCLFVFAMEKEADQLFEGFNVLFTGIGKVNASYYVTKSILEKKPKLIVNLGTAGSPVFKKEEIICCTKFIQRDMDVTGLGIPKYKTPFSEEEIILDYGLKMNGLQEGICGTGDHFETAHNVTDYNVIDMESYAIALIAKQEKIPFLCLKYISDGADDSAANDWQEQVKLAAKKLRALF